MFERLNPRLWLARRAATKATRDGMLDLEQLSPAALRMLVATASSKAIDTARLATEIPIANLGTYASLLKAATKSVWASWKACDLTGQVAGTVPFKVVRGTGTEPTKVDGLDTLLTYPNDTMTFAELVYLTVMHLKMVGNAYWLKVEPTLTGDRPLALIPVNPRRVTIVVNRNTGELEGYRITGGGTTATVPPEEIIHFKRPHPDSDWYGIGDLEAGQQVVGDSVNRGTWKETFWKNGATPSGVLVLDDNPPDPGEWERMKAKFAKEYGGTKNAGKVAWLSGKWSHFRFGLTLAEMSDIENRKLSTEEIFTLHGVPLSVAGIREAANYATAEIDEARFRRYTVLPIIKLIEDTMNTDLVFGYGPQLRITFQVTGLYNLGQIVQNLTPAFDRGWLSINEARSAMGLDPDPENPLWNGHFINAGLMPLDLAGLGDQSATDEAAKGIVQRFVQESFRAAHPSSNGEARRFRVD